MKLTNSERKNNKVENINKENNNFEFYPNEDKYLNFTKPFNHISELNTEFSAENFFDFDEKEYEEIKNKYQIEKNIFSDLLASSISRGLEKSNSEKNKRNTISYNDLNYKDSLNISENTEKQNQRRNNISQTRDFFNETPDESCELVKKFSNFDIRNPNSQIKGNNNKNIKSTQKKKREIKKRKLPQANNFNKINLNLSYMNLSLNQESIINENKMEIDIEECPRNKSHINGINNIPMDLDLENNNNNLINKPKNHPRKKYKAENIQNKLIESEKNEKEYPNLINNKCDIITQYDNNPQSDILNEYFNAIENYSFDSDSSNEIPENEENSEIDKNISKLVKIYIRKCFYELYPNGDQKKSISNTSNKKNKRKTITILASTVEDNDNKFTQISQIIMNYNTQNNINKQEESEYRKYLAKFKDRKRTFILCDMLNLKFPFKLNQDYSVDLRKIKFDYFPKNAKSVYILCGINVN